MTSPEQLRREMDDLGRRMDTVRHEAILRDEFIQSQVNDLRRVSLDIAHGVTTLAALVADLREAQATTDRRWNELIDQLAREHKNGGAK